MNKQLKIVIILVLLSITITARSQSSNSFVSLAKDVNRAWLITKFQITFNNHDKKDLFKKYIVRFSQSDSTSVLITDTTSNIGWKGLWKQNADNKIKLILSGDNSDTSYSKISHLLNSGLLEIVEISEHKMKFKMIDIGGNEANIDFNEKIQ